MRHSKNQMTVDKFKAELNHVFISFFLIIIYFILGVCFPLIDYYFFPKLFLEYCCDRNLKTPIVYS